MGIITLQFEEVINISTTDVTAFSLQHQVDTTAWL